MTAVEAVIFDWGGTLTPWHSIDLVEQWHHYAAVYVAMSDRVAPGDRDAAADGTNPGAEEADLAERLAAAELARWREHGDSGGADGTGSLDHIFEDLGIDVGSARHAEALAAYLRGWDQHTVADPQAAPTLSALRARGIKVGVLSNTLWPRWHHEAVFARDGLLPLIDGAVYSSEIPSSKPHGSAFGEVLEALGVPASAAVFVGDRPWDDIHGAQSAGMRAIFIPHSDLGDQAVDIDVTPDAVAMSLADVVAIVDAWRENSTHVRSGARSEHSP